MTRLHTYYDNLKVPPTASPETIRAAYRQLSQKHHPDRNSGDPEAARIMVLINVAYGALSDPARRARHDRWIAEQEGIRAVQPNNSSEPVLDPQRYTPKPRSKPRSKPRGPKTSTAAFPKDCVKPSVAYSSTRPCSSLLCRCWPAWP